MTLAKHFALHILQLKIELHKNEEGSHIVLSSLAKGAGSFYESLYKAKENILKDNEA